MLENLLHTHRIRMQKLVVENDILDRFPTAIKITIEQESWPRINTLDGATTYEVKFALDGTLHTQTYWVDNKGGEIISTRDY